ncbi:MAG: hypothetical protein ACE5D2_00125 [Fidelibacterota bacterium]
MIKPPLTGSISLLFLSLGIFSCLGPKVSVYPEPILLNKDPDVTIQFTSSDLTIIIPVQTINADPSAFRLTLQQRNRPAEPLMEKIFFPDEPIKVVLPVNIFSSEDLGNMAILTPLGGDFIPQNQFFTVPDSPELQLTPFIIEPPSNQLKITVLDGEQRTPVKGAIVSVIGQSKLLAEGITDSLGYARIDIKAGENLPDKYKVMVSTEGQFPPWSGFVEIKNGHTGTQTIHLKKIEIDSDDTNPYQVLENLVPFKEGPENGATVLFFLSEGERVQVSKVSGDRVFGTVAVQSNNSEKVQLFQGWVLKKYLELIP